MPFSLPNPPRIAVIGLGYVGNTLAVEFAGERPVVGFCSRPGWLEA
ncbi:MAG: hypothetical protein ACX94A_13195 [Algiphilus sp.]